jgi:8-oxo-dGTP diphosphatase
MASDNLIEVVAGVLMRADGAYMLGSRPVGKPYAGYWEFPGGKVEAGESLEQALARELREEMGIGVSRASYWLTRVHHYEHAAVRLHFFRVWDWQGAPQPLEGQQFAWVRPDAVGLQPMLPANGPILKALQLPALQAISCAAEFGAAAVLARLEAPQAPEWVQVREPQLNRDQLRGFCAEVCARVHAYGGRVVVNADPEWLQGWPVDGVHLNGARLAALRQRPDFPWVGASVHDAAGLQRAGELQLDYALLGHVRATPSHPGRQALGWEGFSALVHSGAPLPVYALGGLCPADLAQAQMAAAHGVAWMRGAWR